MFDETEDRLAAQASVPDADVRSALARVLASSEFARSKRVGSFLRFAAEEVLAGRGGRLKAFSIAREVYGRDESFDPRSDTIVRVEAGRLRRLLNEYNEVKEELETLILKWEERHAELGSAKRDLEM